MARTKHEKTEYEKCRRAFRSRSARHVLVLEADMSEDMKRRAFSLSDRLRVCGNKLTAKLEKGLAQLIRTKKYRALLKDYGELTERLKRSPDNEAIKKARKEIASKMSEIQKAYHVSWDDARTYMQFLKDRDNLNSIFALSRVEDIWAGVEKVLFGGAETIHFKKRGELPEIRAKQINRGIVLYVADGKLYFKCSDIGNEKFTTKILDKFQQDEVNRLLDYLASPEQKDEMAVSAMMETGEITDTFRPCYGALVCKKIRGKLRVYMHLTIEGHAAPKYKADGVTPRHTFGNGRIGIDIGTQTVAYTSDKEVGLKNLSERGMSIFHAEKRERQLLRKMDRSRRATNPDNYNADGTIKKGYKKWVKSKRYIEIQKEHANLCRKNAESRKYAIHEDVNHLRCIGDTVITEPPNFKALQKRAKQKDTQSARETTQKKNQQRKRFGKSLKNRCPGTFQAVLKTRFEMTGGVYHEVQKMFRASQYDHTADDYIKKKLSQRMFALEDGEVVQRDWYSSFLLFNANPDFSAPDRETCLKTFGTINEMHIKMIDYIKHAGIHVLNSGIAC